MKVWLRTRRGSEPSPAVLAGREAYEKLYSMTGDHGPARRAYNDAFRKVYHATAEGRAARAAYEAVRRRGPKAVAARRVLDRKYYSDPEHRAAKNTRQKGYRLKRRSTPEGVASMRVLANRRHAKLRGQILKAYGGSCACCGESTQDFLTLDHIQGGGTKHRATCGQDVYSEIRRQGFPKDKYRLLCMNCNFAIRYGDQCPHQKGVAQLLSTLEVAEAL